jgi:hypothetical protein
MVEFISDRVSYIKLRDWCEIIVLNVCVPAEDKSDDKKDGFYEKIECVFNSQSTK